MFVFRFVGFLVAKVLVKNAIAYYYDNMINSTRRVEITKDNDKKGLNLSTVFKVYDEDKHQYTLTLYNTKCKFLVNGKGTSISISNNAASCLMVLKLNFSLCCQNFLF
jgi:hypothetical protein